MIWEEQRSVGAAECKFLDHFLILALFLVACMSTWARGVWGVRGCCKRSGGLKEKWERNADFSSPLVNLSSTFEQIFFDTIKIFWLFDLSPKLCSRLSGVILSIYRPDHAVGKLFLAYARHFVDLQDRLEANTGLPKVSLMCFWW